jgi:hypothetical protein
MVPPPKPFGEKFPSPRCDPPPNPRLTVCDASSENEEEEEEGDYRPAALIPKKKWDDEEDDEDVTFLPAFVLSAQSLMPCDKKIGPRLLGRRRRF